MQVSSLEVYEVMTVDRRTPQDNWGWVELDDLAKATRLENFQLLIRFINFGTPPVSIRGEMVPMFYYMRRACGTDGQWVSYELRALRADRLTDGVCEDCRCGDELTEHTLYRFVEKHSILVPARWAKEVLAEARKQGAR